MQVIPFAGARGHACEDSPKCSETREERQRQQLREEQTRDSFALAPGPRLRSRVLHQANRSGQLAELYASHARQS